jgi:hypothetical protein
MRIPLSWKLAWRGIEGPILSLAAGCVAAALRNGSSPACAVHRDRGATEVLSITCGIIRFPRKNPTEEKDL